MFTPLLLALFACDSVVVEFDDPPRTRAEVDADDTGSVEVIDADTAGDSTDSTDTADETADPVETGDTAAETDEPVDTAGADTAIEDTGGFGCPYVTGLPGTLGVAVGDTRSFALYGCGTIRETSCDPASAVAFAIDGRELSWETPVTVDLRAVASGDVTCSVYVIDSGTETVRELPILVTE